jgi:ribonuclease HI
MKGKVVADFIVDHAVDVDHSVGFVQLKPWELFFDGLVCSKRQGARCVIVSPNGAYIDLSIRLEFSCTNNQVEYKSLLHGIEYLRDLGVRDVDVFGDSNLIVQQVRGDSQYLDGVLDSYRDKCLDIIKLFDMFSIKYIPQEENSQANQLAQQASGYVVNQGVFWITSISPIEHRYAWRSRGKLVTENSDRLQVEGKPIPDNTNRFPGKIGPESRKTEPISRKIESEPSDKIGSREEAKPTLVKKFQEESVTKQDEVENDQSPLDEGKMKPISEDDSVTGGDTIQTDWRLPLLECLRNLEKTTNKKVKWQVLKYTSLDGDLYRRTIDGVLLKCLGEEHAKVAAREVHDGICGAHQSAYKMNWLLRRAGFYWSAMMDDCIKYQKRCEACQKFGNIQLAPASVMNHIVKPWPFRGWGLDFIEEIHPKSSKGHRFILVATDYFTKWAEVVPFRNMTHREIISFVQEHIIYRFGVP